MLHSLEEKVRWLGGTESSEFPHRCPYRPNGAAKEDCIKLSGANLYNNVNGCCGAVRRPVEFEPCTSEARRCIECLRLGRYGEKANAVTNPDTGKCDEHGNGEKPRPRPVVQRPEATIIPFTPRAVTPQEKRISAVSSRLTSRPPVSRENKMAALEAAAAELRGDRLPPYMIEPKELIQLAAEKAGMHPPTLRSFYSSSLLDETRNLLCYGRAEKASSLECRFGMMMRMREEIEKSGQPAPSRAVFAQLVAPELNMQPRSVQLYIRHDLTRSQREALKFGPTVYGRRKKPLP